MVSDYGNRAITTQLLVNLTHISLAFRPSKSYLLIFIFFLIEHAAHAIRSFDSFYFLILTF
jgi:hypothetical protein